MYFGTRVSVERYGENLWAVVTGASDGIGKAMAMELASRGFNILLIARNIHKLNDVAQLIQDQYKKQTKVIVFDFSKDTSIEGYE